MKTILTVSLLLMMCAPAFAAPQGDAGNYCPEDWNRKSHQDHCAHEGKPFRDQNGAPCPGGHLSPIDGAHTSEVRMGTLTECTAHFQERQEYLQCVMRFTEEYYRLCPHYRGYF